MIDYKVYDLTKTYTENKSATLTVDFDIYDEEEARWYSQWYDMGATVGLYDEITSASATMAYGEVESTQIQNGMYQVRFEADSDYTNVEATVTFTVLEKGLSIANTQEPLMASERLDRELDSGNGHFISVTAGKDKILPTLNRYKLAFSDSDNATKDFYFIGKDERARISNGTTTIDRHTLSLTECAKLLQGETLDGFKVVQPTSGTQKTIYDVLTRLLATTPLRKQGQYQKYFLANDTTLQRIYNSTISPQFAWNTQTTLWEALCDIGDVINAIPKLLPNGVGRYNTISYELINKQTAVVNDLIDEYTIGYVEQVDETQYNSQLVTMANNLIEE